MAPRAPRNPVGTRVGRVAGNEQRICASCVGVYLRETKRRNRDGSTVSYLQLAHSERHPVTGVPSAKVIHSFGRTDTVDRDALARLVASISRFLDPAQAIAAAQGAEVEVLDSRRFGERGCWTGCGTGSASAPHCAGSRPGDAWTAAPSSGCCSRWWRSGPGTGKQAGRHALGPRNGGDRGLRPILRRLRLRGNGFPARSTQ